MLRSCLPWAGLAVLFLSSCADLRHNYRYPSGLREDQPQKQGSSGAAFAAAAVGGTALSFVRRPVHTLRIGGMVLWNRPRELIVGNLKIPEGPPPVTWPPGSAEFEHALDEAKIPRAEPGKITWFVNGTRFFPEFNRLIDNARESIDVQAYIYDNDEIAVRLADRLKQRSNEVRVRVLFDRLGSALAGTTEPETPASPGFTSPKSMTRYLREGSSVKVRSSLNPWLVADHTKLHVFDQKVSLMGCANIGREYYNEWHDLMFRVEGPVVARLQEDYHRTWQRADPAGFLTAFRKTPAVATPPAVPGMIPIRVMRTDPMAGRFEIRTSMLMAIRAAKKRVWIEDPFISHDDITEALEEASQRGVDVRVIYPEKNDSKLMDIANRAFANDLVEAGGKAFRYPRMTHLKIMICDDWACVGSANLDTLSMRINRELNLAFNDRKTVNELIRQVFLPDFAISKPHRHKPVTPAGLAEALADQL
jgi:cardiolipin synthase